MVRKKTVRSTKNSRDARGPRGRRGPAGPRGKNGQLVVRLADVLTEVTRELEDVQRTLRVQFTRIAQLQAELDGLRTALERGI